MQAKANGGSHEKHNSARKGAKVLRTEEDGVTEAGEGDDEREGDEEEGDEGEAAAGEDVEPSKPAVREVWQAVTPLGGLPYGTQLEQKRAAIGRSLKALVSIKVYEYDKCCLCRC